MGVKGLPEFIREYAKEAIVPHKLSRCRVIIDGKNLMFHLHTKCSRQTAAFGGDYDLFTAEVDKFFNSLLECHIEACVLLDGGVSMRLSSVKWGVHLLKSGIKACAQIEPGQLAPSHVFPPLLREVFISRVKSHGITVLQSDTSADDDIVTLASTFQLPVLSRDSDFCVHGLAIINLNHLVYSKPVPHEDDPSHFYLRCQVFDKLKFCEVMDINPDHIMLLATLGLRSSLTRFKLAQFIKKISKGVKRDRSKPWCDYTMMVVRHWLAQRKDKSALQLVEQVLDMLPKYREMRYTLRTLLHRVLMITPSVSTLHPWFVSGPGDWPCGHAAFTSGCQANTENRTTPDLIEKVKAKKERHAAHKELHNSFLIELKRLDVACPHALTSSTFAGGLLLPRWFILSQRLCLLDFAAGEIFAKKTLFSMPMIESVSRETASLVSLPILQVLLAIGEKTFFEYEKSYLTEQLQSLEETPGEESAQLAEAIRGNLSDRKLNYYAFKKHLWKLRRTCSKDAATGSGNVTGNTDSSSIVCKSKIDKSAEQARCETFSANVTNLIDGIESDLARINIEADTKEAVNTDSLSISHNLPASPMSISGEMSGACAISNVCPLADNASNESLNCSLPSHGTNLALEAKVDGETMDENKISAVMTLSNDAKLVSKSALRVEEGYESDGSFHSCVDDSCIEIDSFQATFDEGSCSPPETHGVDEDHTPCSEIPQDFDYSYFHNNLLNVPLSELLEPDCSAMDDSCSVTLTVHEEELMAVAPQSNEETGLVHFVDDDRAGSDSDDDVLIEDDDDPSILYKPSQLYPQTGVKAASNELDHGRNSPEMQPDVCGQEHRNFVGNGIHAENVSSVDIGSSLEGGFPLENHNSLDECTSTENRCSLSSNDYSRDNCNLENAPLYPEEINVDSLSSGGGENNMLNDRSFIQNLNSSEAQETDRSTFPESLCYGHSSVKNSIARECETSSTNANTDVGQERNLLGEQEFIVEYSQRGQYELKLLRRFSSVTETALRNHFEVTLKKYQRHTDKADLFEKENKLVDGYRTKIVDKMNTFLQKRMLPVLEKESNSKLAMELEKPLDGDYEKSLLYNSHSASELLPYAMRPLTFFVRRPTMKTIKVVHVQNEKTLEAPSMLTYHLKTVVERKELLCDYVKLELKNFKRLPNEVQIVVLTICYWYQNSRQKLTHYHLYAVLVSLVMFFFIDRKIGKIRWDGKLKEILNLEKNSTVKKPKLVVNTKDPQKNISYISSHLDGLSCAVAALGLLQYHTPGPTVTTETFQRHFVHTLSEFQCCYSSIGSLNSFLGSPFLMPTIDRVLNCTFAYNAFCELSSCKDPGVTLAERLGPHKQMVYLKDALHSCIGDIVLMPRVLNLFPKEVKVSNTEGKKIPKLVNDVDMQKKLRKEQLRINEINELAKIDALVKDIENMNIEKTNESCLTEVSCNKQNRKSKQSLKKTKTR